MTQFAPLQREWPLVTAAAAKAAVRADPRTACFHARRALELAVDRTLRARRLTRCESRLLP